MSNIMLKKRNQRLRREYVDVLSNPIANCAAQPLENDISEWHANIWVEELQVAFHFIINYPSNYPKRAPSVVPCSYIEHPNVFDDYICLDILTMSEETANTPFRGWTPAYTISSLLVQLESFLFEAVNKDGYGYNRMVSRARAYCCHKTGHSHRSFVPEIKVFSRDVKQTSSIVATKVEEDEFFFLAECDNVVLEVFFQFCDEETKTKISHISFGNLDVLDLALARERYKCFYTLQKIGEAGVVLGLGTQTFIMGKRSRKTKKKTKQLQQLHCSFDFLSHDAFKQGVRNNIWKDQEFDNFMPLYINSHHGKYAIPVAEKCIFDMWNHPELTNKCRGITPSIILETLTKMMNTTVVNMMKTVEDLEAGELQLFDSIKALEGFCSMHHLLLAFAHKYPNIKEIATQKVKRFIENPEMRDKEVTPDIGELMIDVAVSDYCWDDFSTAWLEETFIRNARWICAKYPNLLKIENCSSCVRLTQSFNATRTGKRLAMFQRFFISEIASPARLRGNKSKNSILLKEYNLRMGLPQRGMAERLQAHSRKVIGCTNWWDYFTLVDFCPPGHAYLSAWLRNSVQISEIKQYHSSSSILHFDKDHITSPGDTHQRDGLNCLCAGSMFKLPEGCKVIPGVNQPQLLQKKKSGVDICFVMDCTGSMTSWIATAKQRIQEIIESVSRQSSGTVRFAIVGYRDHDSPGYGDDSWVLKKFDFTSSGREASLRVNLFHVGGGGGHEAMCCAMRAAASMSWNRDSHQICVLIGDQPPHGLGGYGDYSYPDGCPCGEDTLRVVHTMEKTGVVVYPVDCGQQDAQRETFYHALARITGGYAINLRESQLLPEIVFGACMEEKLMDKLADVIAPVYEVCLKSHSGGRFEQHCRSVYAELNAKGIKVESCLPPDNYDETIEHQVDCLAYCMDIKQAKAMCESEYFVPINRQTKICSYMERPVTQGQITKCMKRMKSVLAERTFLREGCQYKSSDRFSKDSFKTRWMTFKRERKLRSFAPWNRLTPDLIRQYSKIPDGAKLRRAINTRNTTRLAMSTVIGRTLVGKEIKVELGNCWHKVFVEKILRGGKVRVLMPDGFDRVIPETTNWKTAVKEDPWGKTKNEAEKATPAPAPAARAAPAPAPAPAQPRQQPQPQQQQQRPVNQNRVVQPRQPVANNNGYVLGQLVNCKATKEGPIYVGIVQNLSPLILQVQGFPPSQWRYVRPRQMTEVILPEATNVYASPQENVIPTNRINAGTKIRILEYVGDFAHIIDPFDGWVRKPQPRPTNNNNVSINKSMPSITEFVLNQPTQLYSLPNAQNPWPMNGILNPGTPVKILEFVGPSAHIIHPVDAFILTPSSHPNYISSTPRNNNSAPSNSTMMAPPPPSRTNAAPMLPTIEVRVTADMSAKDLAMACQNAGILPKKVSIKLVGNLRIGVVGFENHGQAASIMAHKLYHNGQPIQTRWSKEYRAQESAI